MSKQQSTAGVGYHPITIDGVEYKLRPLEVGVYAEMEAYIVSLRGNPLEEVSKIIDSIPKEHHKDCWDAALRMAVAGRTVATLEASQFENSVAGIAWKFWKCLNKEHPEISSVEAATKLMIKAGKSRLPEIVKAIEIGSGEAELGNSSGQVPNQTDETDLAGQ